MDSLTLHIGDGADLDGGPYHAATVTETKRLEGTRHFLIEHDDGGRVMADADEIGRHLSDEIVSDEPVSVSGLPYGDETDAITLPLRPGFVVEAGDQAWAVEEIDRDDLIDVQQAADRHGGRLAPN